MPTGKAILARLLCRGVIVLTLISFLRVRLPTVSDGNFQTAPYSSRLGQLQRGRGKGFCAALVAGKNAHEDVLHCLTNDPRVNSQIESRERYYAELVMALDVPIAPLIDHLAGREAELGHSVLAGTWRLGHSETRSFIANPNADEAVVKGIAQQLWGLHWAQLVDLSGQAAKAFLQEALEVADCAQSSRRRQKSKPLPGEKSVPELLEIGRHMHQGQRWAIVEELCRRGTEEDRIALADTVKHDMVYDRVRLAAQALGTLGDERLLPLAIDYFGREDVITDPDKRLAGYDRMRRSALNDYVCCLPADRQLELAREWHARGGYFETVAGGVFGEQATPDDRTRLENFIVQNSDIDGGWEVISELDALGRIGDPRSAPLLIQIAEHATYSHARRRALHALSGMQDLPAAVAALHEALWDCEDESAFDACAHLPTLDQNATSRISTLATHCLAQLELQTRASKRLRNIDK